MAVLDGFPVAVSTVYTRDGIAVIGGVATLSEVRRRGIGALVTAVALLDARRRGYRVAVLQASTMGRSVYERLGFVETGPFARHATADAAFMVPPQS